MPSFIIQTRGSDQRGEECDRPQAGSAVDDPPTAPRPPHTLCGHRRRCDTSPRGSAERSAPPSSPESAAERPFGESSTSCTEYRGEFSVFGAQSICSTGALSTNPATAPPPAKLFCSVRTITLESAAERARRALAPTHIFLGASGAARLSSLQCGSASRSRSASSLERAAERPRSVLVSPKPCTRP